MTDLLALALDAIDDPEGVVVLADEVRERAWFDHRAARLLISREGLGLAYFDGGLDLERKWFEEMIFFWDRLPHAIAATLLFGDWPTAWPLADRLNEPYEMRLGMYGAFDPGSFGVNRETDPTRLAGMRLETRAPAGRLAEVSRLLDLGYITRAQAQAALDPSSTIIESRLPIQVYTGPDIPRGHGYLVSPADHLRIINLGVEAEKESVDSGPKR